MSVPGPERNAVSTLPKRGEASQPKPKGSVPELLGATWDALRGVYDPELSLDVVALGLVYDVGVEDGGVVVEMTMTTPGCPASEALPEMARSAISASLGKVVEVEVRVAWDPPWSPAMMDEEAARAQRFRSR